MRVKFYCDLYVSQGWQKKKTKIMKLLCRKKLHPSVYLVALAQGEQNQLEIFSSILLRQHVFNIDGLFVVGIMYLTTVRFL